MTPLQQPSSTGSTTRARSTSVATAAGSRTRSGPASSRCPPPRRPAERLRWGIETGDYVGSLGQVESLRPAETGEFQTGLESYLVLTGDRSQLHSAPPTQTLPSYPLHAWGKRAQSPTRLSPDRGLAWEGRHAPWRPLLSRQATALRTNQRPSSSIDAARPRASTSISAASL